MKDKTKVKPKNVAKVAEIKAENPHATYVEIQRQTGLTSATISKATQELKCNGSKDETIRYIVGSAKERIKRVSGIFDRYIDQIEAAQELKQKDIALAKDIVKDDMTRVTVFGGDVTDPEGGLKQQTLTDKQLQALDALNNIFG